ncbi:hypothetical protein DL766_008783 [Monosporascus sp. MC13-8B]|uniref:Methyltransferase domain-containing protein n=1 Tax=Monosporascus cannonballus TaxID=155416 RepID=A0ABY0HGN0_9PEZI|nr:hypothetical protein DL762_001559 [Monosporascus cannonballus]RYP18014.1 hypothetical protein DL766_008783 [Monosporascus sp. MC13-8B]
MTNTGSLRGISNFWIAPGRNFRTSARLHLQHFLFQNTLGHLLNPHIPSSVVADSKILKVADLGCGNGAWLIDLDRELSNKGVSAQLDGYDINAVNFPASAFLPSSISLKKLDILARPLPEEIVGVYDIVHVRAFVSIIVNSDLTPLLSTVLALLKPGGWLQWEETRAEKFLVDSPSPSNEISRTACDTISHILKAGGEARGLNFEILGELDQHLQEHGFLDVSMEAAEKRKQDFKGWTEDYLMVWEEMAEFFPPKATVTQGQVPMTRESWVELFEKAVHETERGIVIHQGKIMTVVGRKAA